MWRRLLLWGCRPALVAVLLLLIVSLPARAFAPVLTPTPA